MGYWHKVSVVIPYYKNEDTILRALSSVLAQDYGNYEVIVVDDGSVDKSHTLVDGFISKLQGSGKSISFQHISQSNGGPSAARNTGILAASGEYIAFLDADDSWETDKLVRQVKFLDKNPDISILGTGTEFITGETEGRAAGVVLDSITNMAVRTDVESGMPAAAEVVSDGGDYSSGFKSVTFSQRLFKAFFLTSSIIVRRKVFDYVSLFETGQNYAEDTLFVLRVLRYFKGGYLDIPLIKYYKMPFGSSGLTKNILAVESFELKNYKTIWHESKCEEEKREYPQYRGAKLAILLIAAILFSIVKFLRRALLCAFRQVLRGRAENRGKTKVQYGGRIEDTGIFKVLHITQATSGGVYRYLEMLLSRLNREKYISEVCCPDEGPMKKGMEALGINVYPERMSREISLINDLRSYFKIKKVIRKSMPDIIHVHSTKAGVIGGLAARSMKVPCIYTPHGWSFSMEIPSKKKHIYACIERYVCRSFERIVNISEYERELAFKYKIAPPDRMCVIHNGIDCEIVIQAAQNMQDCSSRGLGITEVGREKLGIPVAGWVVGMVARICRQKSPETFVKLADILSRRMPDSYFVLVGDGELRGEIEALIKSYDLGERFLITGWTDKAAQYIAAFDAAILCSKWEGFGLVLAEYMALGKPVVASEVGGIPEVVKDGFNGMLVEADDAEGFAEAILKLRNDPELRDRLIRNALKTVTEKFEVARVVSSHESLYAEVNGI